MGIEHRETRHGRDFPVDEAARLLAAGVYLPDYPVELIAEAWRRNYAGAAVEERDRLRMLDELVMEDPEPECECKTGERTPLNCWSCSASSSKQSNVIVADDDSGFVGEVTPGMTAQSAIEYGELMQQQRNEEQDKYLGALKTIQRLRVVLRDAAEALEAHGDHQCADVCWFAARMGDIEHSWTILHRRDWGHKHDSLVTEGTPIPDPDDDLAVIEVVPVSQLQGAVEAELRAIVDEVAVKWGVLHGTRLQQKIGLLVLDRLGGR